MSDTYTCAACGGTFTADRPDADAQAEYERLFPVEAATNEPREVVCDDCFNAIVADHAPAREIIGRIPLTAEQLAILDDPVALAYVESEINNAVRKLLSP